MKISDTRHNAQNALADFSFLRSKLKTCALLAICGCFTVSPVLADQHTAGVPVLNSRPGAEYTIYIDMAGFNYTGQWSNNELGDPGTTLAVGDVASNGTFNAAQVTELKNIWSRLAQCYIGFNVNVTTVDPAIAAGQAATDLDRQHYYDAQPNMMHTVIGSQVRGGTLVTGTNPEGKWYSTGADGVSGLNVVAGVTGDTGNGGHTNWMFTEDQQGVGFINGDYIGSISAHENGHAFGLTHQGDWTGATKVNEYSNGDAVGTTATPGTYVPILGNASDRQRVAWRLGDANVDDAAMTVNDVKKMLAQNSVAFAAVGGSSGLDRSGVADLHLIEDGIGHTRPTATPLSLTGHSVDFALAKGVIVPLSESDPTPIGANHYTQDWFSFYTDGGDAITLTATDGTSFLTPGVADGIGMLRSTLTIYNSVGTIVGVANEDASTLFETFNSLLDAGTYFAKLTSFGGHEQDSSAFNAASYFDMGAFFLTGSGFDVVPEPASIGLMGISVFSLLGRRRRRFVN